AGCAVVVAIRLFIGGSVPAAHVARKPVIETLVMNGRVLARYRPEIGAAMGGVVRDVLAEEGDEVKAGPESLRLDDSELKSLVVESRSRVRQSEARLRLVNSSAERANAEGLQRARAILAEAENAWKRQQALFAEGVTSQSAVDTARRAVEVARSDVASAEALALTTREGGDEVRLASAALDEARAALESATARLDKATVRAPSDGVVLSRLVAPGAAVQAGEPLFVMAFQQETLLLAQPDEKALPLVRVGQKAKASADAYPREAFDAEVSYVSPSVDLQRGTFDVKLSVPKPPAYLKTDMTLSVEIIVGEKSDALVIPVDAVRDIATEPWVVIIHTHKARRQPVEIGLRGEAYVEIEKGLAEGDIVALAPGLAMVGNHYRADIAKEK
ncbi:MAG: efflux RND transporter periplasmic adaptor subunit, partial [Thermoanaerobaculia bacterium]|nr:efflux RND transporter periplasmic adaptor subunit [Thermoanaerobaculia bacterium]